MTTIHPMEQDTQIADETTLGDKARDAAKSVRDRTAQTVDAARDSARAGFEKGVDHLSTARSEAESAIRRNPGLAIAGAVGVGILLGMALKSRA